MIYGSTDSSDSHGSTDSNGSTGSSDSNSNNGSSDIIRFTNCNDSADSNGIADSDGSAEVLAVLPVMAVLTDGHHCQYYQFFQ